MDFDRGAPERLVRDPKNRPELVLRRIQAELMPDHELDIVCINLINGEWVIGKTLREAQKKFRAKWPDYPYYFCRVDGGPAGRL